MISNNNPWSYDIPASFEKMEMTFTDTECNTFMSSENNAYYLTLAMYTFNTIPVLSKIKTLSEFSKWAVGSDTIIINKDIIINDMPALYYRTKNDSNYSHLTIISRNEIFYLIGIIVPFTERNKYEKPMDSFIYSIKFDDDKEGREIETLKNKYTIKKKGELLSFNEPSEKVLLLLYNDRLEWKGPQGNFYINLCDVASVKAAGLNTNVRIIMHNQTKFEFGLDSKDITWSGKGNDKLYAKIKSWALEINKLIGAA
jgi:hypothetical protein